jgi:thiol-disulfide isomerase/thioredoxin
VRRLLAALLVLAFVAAGCSGKPAGVTLGDEQPTVNTVKVDTPELQALRAKTQMAACQPGPGGGALPDLTLACLGGGTPVDLASLKGPMLLNFWGAWCKPCRQEMPLLQQFYAAHGDQVPVLGVDWQDQYPAEALKQIAERDVSYPSLADPSGETQEKAEFAKVPGMPMTYLIDASGKIAYVQIGQIRSEQQLTDLVREHLGVSL